MYSASTVVFGSANVASRRCVTIACASCTNRRVTAPCAIARSTLTTLTRSTWSLWYTTRITLGLIAWCGDGAGESMTRLLCRS